MQRLDYATLRPDAISAGLLTAQNDQLYDVPNRSASPYTVQTLFAAAPARNTVPTASVAFVFRRNLFLSGDGRLPSQLDT